MSLRRVVTLAALLATVAAPPAGAVKVATWNLLQYPALDISSRQQHFRTVMAALDPDVLVCQEINTLAGRDSFLTNVLGVIQPGQWSGQWVNVQSGEGMAVFWKTAKVACFNFSQYDPPNGPRDVFFFGVRPAGYNAATFFRVYSIHLKAGQTAADSTTRRLECTQIRTSLLNAVPAGTHYLIGGDSNFYGDFEGGYIRLTESQADNDGRCSDPDPLAGDWGISTYASRHTQCPCLSGCPSGFSGGGLDDRFDIWLTSFPMTDGEGFDWLPGTYKAYGNDGLHYNNDINADGFNFAVPLAVANALHNASDHIPAVIEVQVPAEVAAASQLGFGRVIVGAAAPSLTLDVSNPAVPPADELNYTLSAPAGFTAPAGPFVANAGAAANSHAIGMPTASVGVKTGDLTVSSDAPDTVSKIVKLSGAVLRHASPSWDSLASVPSTTFDLGGTLAGQWQDQELRLYNFGYDANLQASMTLGAPAITGGDGRFSFVGILPNVVGFATNWSIHFDDAGATLDTTYSADLSIPTADEPIPGGTALATLHAQVHVTLFSGSTDAPSAGVSALRFLAPRPNPVSRATRFAFELPADATVSLEVFDLGGRRVARLASGALGAGRHERAWNATDEHGGRVPGGLYFARFRTRGLDRTERVIVLP